jgi:hypothetical protein
MSGQAHGFGWVRRLKKSCFARLSCNKSRVRLTSCCDRLTSHTLRKLSLSCMALTTAAPSKVYRRWSEQLASPSDSAVGLRLEAFHVTLESVGLSNLNTEVAARAPLLAFRKQWLEPASNNAVGVRTSLSPFGTRAQAIDYVTMV